MADFNYDIGGYKYGSNRELSNIELQKVYDSAQQSGLTNPEVIGQQEMRYEDVVRNQGLLNAYKTYHEADSGEAWSGTNEELADEYYEQMRYFENNTASMARLVGRLNAKGAMSEEERQSLSVMFGAWDEIVPFYSDDNQMWEGFIDHLEVNILDPVNFAGIGTLGAGFVASQAAKKVTKAAALSALKKGAVAGAAMGGGFGVGNEEIRTELGQQEEIDYGNVAMSAGVGALAGGAIGGVVDGFAGLAARRAAQKATREAQVVEKHAAELVELGTKTEQEKTLHAAKNYRELLENPEVTGEWRQAAHKAFLEDIGHTAKQRVKQIDREKVTNAQAYEDGKALLDGLDIKYADDLTPEKLVDKLYEKYVDGKIAAKDINGFQSLTMSLEKEMYDKFLKAWDKSGGDPWKNFSSFEKAIALSQHNASQAGRLLQAQKLRQRLQPAAYADLLTHLKKKGELMTMSEVKQTMELAAAKGPSFGNKVVDAANSFWINNILGSPVTLGINMASSFGHMIERNTIDIVGAVGSGNRKEMRRAFNTLVYEMEALPEAFRYATRAFGRSKGYIDPSRVYAGETDELAQGIGTRDFDLGNLELRQAGESVGDVAANAVGNLNRFIGGRGMIATDELVKQMSFRGRLRADVQEEAMERLGKPTDKGGFRTISEAEEWSRREFAQLVDKHIDSVGRGVAPEDPKLLKALEEARQATFQGDYANDPFGAVGKRVASFSTKHPLMKQIAPFIRTPSNLVSWAAERTPGLQMLNKDFMARLSSPDQAVRSQAEAAVQMGTLYWGAAMAMAMSGDLQGPGQSTDYKKQKVREQGDFLPYSIRLADGTRVQIRRGDPMARFFMTLGSMQDALVYSDAKGLELFAAAAINTAKVVVEVPSLTGIADLFDTGIDMATGADPMGSGEKYIYNKAKTFAPYYRFYRDVLVPQGADKLMFTNIDLNPTDMWNTAYFQNDPNDPYDVQRDVVGNKMSLTGNAGFDLSGFASIEANKNPLANELATLGSSRFSPPKTKDGINLQELKAKPNGRQSVYDMWRQATSEIAIDGVTLEKALDDMMESEIYTQELGDVSRKKALESIISSYENVAFYKVLPTEKYLGKEHELWAKIAEVTRRDALGTSQSTDLINQQNRQQIYNQLHQSLIGNQ